MRPMLTMTGLSKAEVNAGAPGGLHLLSNLLGWNILHLRSNLSEWL